MKKICYILSVLFALASCSESEKPVVVVENATVAKDSANVTVDLNYPIVVDARSAMVKEAVNLRMGQILWEQTPRAEDPNDEDLRSIVYDQEMGRPVSSEMHWNMYAGDKLVSVELGGYWYTGGAHGMSFQWVEHFNAQNGEPIFIRDYIIDSVAILDIISEELASDSIQLGSWCNELMLPSHFRIDSVSLTAIYNQYDIAPYAAGIIEVPIHFSQIPGAVDTTALSVSTLRIIHGK